MHAEHVDKATLSAFLLLLFFTQITPQFKVCLSRKFNVLVLEDRQPFIEVEVASGIYPAARQRGKYPTPATDTELNSCRSIY